MPQMPQNISKDAVGTITAHFKFYSTSNGSNITSSLKNKISTALLKCHQQDKNLNFEIFFVNFSGYWSPIPTSDMSSGRYIYLLSDCVTCLTKWL